MDNDHTPNTSQQERIEAARQAREDRFEREITRALGSTSDNVRVWPPDWKQQKSIEYFYRHESLLVRDHDLDRVTNLLDSLGVSAPDSAEPKPAADSGRSLTHGISRVPARLRESVGTGDLVKDLDDRLGRGVVTHEHAFTVSYGAGCPATEPAKVVNADASRAEVGEAVWPRVGDPSAGRDISISVVDSGLLEGVSAWAPWLSGVLADPQDIEPPDEYTLDGDVVVPGSDMFADPYAGHGTFIAGVVRCLVPAATVSVERYAGTAGFILESSMIRQISDGLGKSPDIINMSAGGYTRNNIPPLSFELVWETRLRHLGGIAFVAAAGNDETRAPFWPAAFPWCVGVGSMTRDGQERSWFTNHGAWVDVYAPGEDIVNAYPRLPYKSFVDGKPRDTSAGIASWSGTSFATPIVTGLIAARMSRTGENGQEAARSVLDAARGQFKPGVGPRLFP